MGRLRILFVTAFVDMVGLAMIGPLLPFYATQFGSKAAVVGVLVAAFSIAQLACAPLWGRFSDRYGRRPAILAGLLITAAAYGLFAMAGSLVALFLSRIVQGAGGGTIGVVQAYVADASAPEQRTKSLGWLSAVTSFGAVVGPAFGSLLVALGGRRAPGLAAAVLALLVAGFASRYLSESRELRPSGAYRAVPSRTGRGAVAYVLARWHEPAPRLIWIYAVVVRALVLGRIVDRLGEARLSRVGIVLLSAGLAATGLAHGGLLFFIGFTLMPLGTAFLFPCVTGLLSRVIPSGERGLYMGVQHTFGGVSRVAFPIAAGLAMDHLGMGVPFWVAGLLVLATLPLTGALAGYLGPEPAQAEAAQARQLSAAELTGEFPVEPAPSAIDVQAADARAAEP